MIKREHDSSQFACIEEVLAEVSWKKIEDYWRQGFVDCITSWLSF